MKAPAALLLTVLTFLPLTGHAEEEPPQTPADHPEISTAPVDAAPVTPSTPAKVQAKTPMEISGWGTATDPDADCKFFTAEGALLINVPGGRPHDLAAEIGRTNAPRVLQGVHGDFTLQVKVEGRFTPGDESTQEGRTGYNGGALVALADERNVVTLARAVLQRPGEEPQPYANFEIRIDGELQRIGSTGDLTLPTDGPVYLRLERRESKFLAATSVDGITWTALEPKEVPAEWSKKLQAGVAAITTSMHEFSPRFSELQVVK